MKAFFIKTAINKRLHTVLSTIVSACLFSSYVVAQAPPLPLFKAQYDATIKGFSIKATRELRQLDNKQFELEFKATSWAANTRESSVFSYNSGRLYPSQYQYYQSAFGKKRERALVFEENTIRSTHKDESVVLDNTERDVLDKLSYQLQLQLDLLHQSNTASKNLRYIIANKNQLKPYQFEIVDEELIETQSGKLNTVKVKVLRDNSDKITYIWFAKDWQYLLVQLKQFTKDKQQLSIHLNAATVNGHNVTGL